MSKRDWKIHRKKYMKEYREKHKEKSRAYGKEYMRRIRLERRRIYLLFARNPERDIKEDFDKGDLEYIKKINDK